MAKLSVSGILLAAGSGRRFSPDGTRSKLLAELPGRGMVVEEAARHLRAVLPDVLAVIRPDSATLRHPLLAAGCDVTECAGAGEGMAVSLVHALRLRDAADGWVIALADMPDVQPATIAKLIAALAEGADIAVPTFQGRRGNPVAFSRQHLSALLALHGDQGARRLLQSQPVTEVAVEDAGIHRDIDTPADLGM